MSEIVARVMAILIALAHLIGTAGVATPAVRATPAPTKRPAPEAGRLSGLATWYDWRPGQAAAGPGLRSYLGPGWRGTVVRVCTTSRCVNATLTDWCACGGGRIIDLDRRLFAALASPSRGVIRVEIRR